MINRIRNTVITIGIILVVVTLALFFMLSENRITMDWLCLSFILFSEIIVIISILMIEGAEARHTGVLLRAGGYSTIALYSVISISLSIIFLLILREEIKFFVTLQMILLVIAAIILLLIYISSSHVNAKNMDIMMSAIQMQEISNRVAALQSSAHNKVYELQLNKLYDAIRYCDVSASTSIDNQVANKIAELELLLNSELADKLEAVNTLTDDILVLMKQRSLELSRMKAGGM